MHRKNTHRLAKLFSVTGLLAMLFGGLVTHSVRAVSGNPAPVCVGAYCTVTFEFTGDYYLWSPPANAYQLGFDLLGAQGGRAGGLGGRVSGRFINPPSEFYIYVGGAGKAGKAAAGGFNGGGNAANGNNGDEGSGGGATDIRLTQTIDSRIAVAGGGGGSGGQGGEVGGGGGLNGVAGTNGQSQGGTGATQTAVGIGGSGNGGSKGSNGFSAVGGAGGFGMAGGGGGGGGGYFGGGGGGGDNIASGKSAGGGGGGSSWVSQIVADSIAYADAYRSGAGLAIISYRIPASVISFAPAYNLSNAPTINYELKFDDSVIGLTGSDFSIVGSTANCSDVSVAGGGANYTVSVSGCGDGLLQLSLPANSVSGVGGGVGPLVSNTAADILLDYTKPSASISVGEASEGATEIIYSIVFSEPVTAPIAANFAIDPSGCEVSSIVGEQTNYTVSVIGCPAGVAIELRLLAGSIADLASNLGPVSDLAAATVLIPLPPAPPEPTPEPSAEPTVEPSQAPTGEQTIEPTDEPTTQPSLEPTPEPSVQPEPSASPTPRPIANDSGSQNSGTGGSTDSISNGAGAGLGDWNIVNKDQEIIKAAPAAKTYFLDGDAYQPLATSIDPVQTETEYLQSQRPRQSIAETNLAETKLATAGTENFDWRSLASLGLGATATMFAGGGLVKAIRRIRTKRLVSRFG